MFPYLSLSVGLFGNFADDEYSLMVGADRLIDADILV